MCSKFHIPHVIVSEFEDSKSNFKEMCLMIFVNMYTCDLMLGWTHYNPENKKKRIIGMKGRQDREGWDT